MMGFLYFLILCGALAVLRQTDAQSFTCSVGSGGACPVAFCPGDEVTYTCDVGVAMGTTTWKLPDGTCGSPSTIILAQSSDCSTDADICGPFSAGNDGKDGTNCLVSSLNVTASTDLNNTLIQCSNVDLMSNPTEVDSAVLTIAVPPPPPTGVSVASCTGDSVTLVWEEPTENVTSYVLSATPTVENCNTTCNTASRQYLFTGLLPGVDYSVTVRADKCDGNLQGETSLPLVISVDGIGSIAVEVSRVYDANNMLSRIDVMWNPLCQPFDSYTVTLTRDGIPMSIDAQCCSANFTISTDSVSSYSVQVSGAGVSSPVMAGISAANDQLSVEVESNCTAVTATCSFLSGFNGTDFCIVEYGTSPDSLEYSATSQQMGSAGESVTVELTEASSFSTTYHYQAAPSGDTPPVKMKGSFTTYNGEGCVIITNCRESDLFEGGDDTNPSLCHAGEMPVEIPGGVLSCTGLTPGSTATASCEDGYEPSGEVVCQVDGTWNGTTPTCEKAGGDDGGGNSTPVIIGVVIAVIIILVIAALVVLLLLYFLMKKKQKKSDKHSGPLVQVQVNEQDFVARDSPIDPGTRVSGVVGAMGTIDRKEQQPTSRMSSTFESSHRDPETGEATNGESHHQYSGSKIKKKKRTSRVTSDSSTAELQKSMPEEVLYADLSHEGRRPAPPPPAEEPVVYSEVKTSTSAM